MSASDVRFFAFGCLIFHEQGARVGISAAFYLRRWNFWCACQRVGRAYARNIIFFSFFFSFVRDLGGGREGVPASVYSQRRLI